MNTRYLTLIIAMISTLIVACNKFLSEDPKTQYTTGNFFKNETSLNAGLVGIYASFRNLYDMNTNTPLFMTEVGTDELMFKGSSGIRYNFDRYTFSSSEGGIDQYWVRNYAIAMEATMLLNAMDNVHGISDSARNRIAGEARFVRAYIYFRLVQAFGAIPIVGKAIDGDFDYGAPRESIKNVYDFILSDFRFAAQDNVLTTAKTNDGHPNHWAAKSLLGKVYLTMTSAKETALTKQTGKVDGYKEIDSSTHDLYAASREILKDVIDNSGADLLSTYSDVFKIENKNVNKESI